MNIHKTKAILIQRNQKQVGIRLSKAKMMIISKGCHRLKRQRLLE